MYAHPFSADYWRDASREVRDLRKLLFSALMIALCIVLAQVPSVPLFGGAKVTWGFLAGPSVPGSAARCWACCSPLRRTSSASSSLEEAAIPFSPAIL